MTWWHLLLALAGLALVLFAILAAFYLGMAKAGNVPEFKKKVPPRPVYQDPARANKIIADRKREQDEISAGFRA